MINHISLNAILKQVSENPNIRYIEVVRNYKDNTGVYPADLFKCIHWTHNCKNSFFTYPEGTLVSLEGRLEVIDKQVIIVVECLSFLASCEQYNTFRST